MMEQKLQYKTRGNSSPQDFEDEDRSNMLPTSRQQSSAPAPIYCAKTAANINDTDQNLLLLSVGFSLS